MLMNEAEERFSLIGQLTTQELEGLFRSSALSVNLLAQQRLTEAGTLAARMANIPYMATLLRKVRTSGSHLHHELFVRI